jgi:hypothetical protein
LLVLNHPTPPRQQPLPAVAAPLPTLHYATGDFTAAENSRRRPRQVTDRIFIVLVFKKKSFSVRFPAWYNVYMISWDVDSVPEKLGVAPLFLMIA